MIFELLVLALLTVFYAILSIAVAILIILSPVISFIKWSIAKCQSRTM